jgi:hypothetical protein
MVSAERFAQGMTFPEYLAQLRTNRDALARRFDEAAIRPEDREAIAALGRKVKILVITEDWCGDSLRNVPVLAKLVDGLPDVELRVFLRDDNPDLMNQYLKRGQFRSIPVFVFFDEEMNEVARLLEAKMHVVDEIRTLLNV